MLLIPIGLMAPIPAAVAAPGLLLDHIAVVGAYSVRKLLSAYAGPCLRVRRDSDNAEQDVGFAAGALDTAAMLAFCGSGSGFVPKWYDQSAAAHHAFNLTATGQYRIVNAGALATQGGQPCLAYGGGGGPCMALPSGMFTGLSSSTAFCLFSQAPGNSPGWWIIGSSGMFTHTPYGDNTSYEQYLSTSRQAFPGYLYQPSAMVVHTAQNDGAALSVFRNGGQCGTAQAVTFTNKPTVTTGDYRYAQVNLSEMILTAAALSVANRQAVERSMGAYYGVAVA